MSNGAEAAMPRLLLDAAARLLRTRSYEGTTVRAIAAEVGIQAGSIYHHFRSKDAIVAAVVNEGVRIVQDAVAAALAALPEAGPAIRLEAALRAHLQASLEHSDYTSASMRTFPHLPPALRAECRAPRRGYEIIWEDLVYEAAAAGLIAPGISRDAARLMLLGAVNWAGEWYRPGRLGIERIAADFAALVLRPHCHQIVKKPASQSA